MVESVNTNPAIRYFNWWLRQLAVAITPRRTSTRSWRTLARQTPDGLEVVTRSGTAVSSLGTLPADATANQVAVIGKLVAQKAAKGSNDVVLRIAPENVVERIIQIPKAASDVIEPVLRNQMERIVPWGPDETRYGYRVANTTAAASDQLDIQVVATTRSAIESALRRAQSIGLNPFAVDFVSPQSTDAQPVELMSLAPDPVKRTAEAIKRGLAVVAALGTAITAFGLYLMWNLEIESSDLEARIAAARSRVEEVKRLNEENSELRQQRERLVRRKSEEPSVIVLIEALSRALPDTAYLTELEIHGRDTRIAGKSDDPTGLIPVLEATPQFERVQFSAPTTREEGETQGTFSIISRAHGGSNLEPKP